MTTPLKLTTPTEGHDELGWQWRRMSYTEAVSQSKGTLNTPDLSWSYNRITKDTPVWMTVVSEGTSNVYTVLREDRDFSFMEHFEQEYYTYRCLKNSVCYRCGVEITAMTPAHRGSDVWSPDGMVCDGCYGQLTARRTYEEAAERIPHV